MVQSPSSVANWFAASQEIPRISRNPKIHYRTHKRPPPVSILGQPKYPHPTSWRSILILSTHLRLGLHSGLFPFGFPPKTLYTPLSSPIRATCPAQFFLECEMFGQNFLEKIKTGILCSTFFFSDYHAIYEIMWKNSVQPERPQVMRMRISCWISKAKYTNSEYITPIGYSPKQRLHQHLSMLRLLHCRSYSC